jgi:hypothetical protein
MSDYDTDIVLRSEHQAGQNERNALLVRISVHRNEYRTKY